MAEEVMFEEVPQTDAVMFEEVPQDTVLFEEVPQDTVLFEEVPPEPLPSMPVGESAVYRAAQQKAGVDAAMARNVPQRIPMAGEIPADEPLIPRAVFDGKPNAPGVMDRVMEGTTGPALEAAREDTWRRPNESARVGMVDAVAMDVNRAVDRRVVAQTDVLRNAEGLVQERRRRAAVARAAGDAGV